MVLTTFFFARGQQQTATNAADANFSVYRPTASGALSEYARIHLQCTVSGLIDSDKPAYLKAARHISARKLEKPGFAQ
jgi:hypothetical protein